MTQFVTLLEDEAATVALGKQLAGAMTPPLTVYLNGDLGAGKTTFSRGVIQHLGHQGAVKSPTYALVEPYEIKGIDVFHFDLYRVADPEELEFMGIRDYFTPNSICLVEWPENGCGLIAEADLQIYISYKGEQRQISIEATTELGQKLVSKLK
ncbi:tRNA (adenosine(37)-N6)-threonylcarbamoyltransferase complex ATPase subunit type 1 TsaE [Shewanella sp. WXL01]|uniref:tRNA (adenosine(37)-N6)-threonylcarbamoyltransferase complex ATPase subunit type 1 TsaE n=1 Tax=Shewanella sp. WXL01 TaxID=2709721 RepID=UPI00143844F4|nr:tRNA (adenosine(37)-N6)-threonylcarbamoyltransferase complex ATPase subunit type 1 TsaE [Shewanella sp. WXL01]NKF49499.1 tRNA (adenosine(37)-N6)-threonylcarbamoyltransferase complex ATPase subunit type 1 TsaE [Shewanella sp. WXL01]